MKAEHESAHVEAVISLCSFNLEIQSNSIRYVSLIRNSVNSVKDVKVETMRMLMLMH